MVHTLKSRIGHALTVRLEHTEESESLSIKTKAKRVLEWQAFNRECTMLCIGSRFDSRLSSFPMLGTIPGIAGKVDKMIKLDKETVKAVGLVKTIRTVTSMEVRSPEEVASLSAKTQERMTKTIESYIEAGVDTLTAEIATTSKVKTKIQVGKLEVSPTSKIGRLALALQKVQAIRKAEEEVAKAA